MTTMTTDQRTAFLAAIIAAPEDDTPRLIFADWLEENGEPERAEFIRVQCELATMKEPEELTIAILGGLSQEDEWQHTCRRCRSLTSGWCPFHTLRRRERELLGPWIYSSSPAARWMGPLLWNLAATTSHCPAPVFRRGFVSSITCTAEDWLRHADTLTAAAPIEAVTLTTGPMLVYSDAVLHDGINRRVGIDGRRQWSFPELAQVAGTEKAGRVFAGIPTTRDGVLILLSVEWPRITFTLPERNR